MNIIVCLKPVPDVKIVSMDPFDPHRLDQNDLIYTANPYELAAVEAAIALREKWPNGRVTIVSVAPSFTEPIIRKGLDLGANEAIRIWDRGFDSVDGFAIGSILGKVISLMPFDVVFCGSMAPDTCAGQVGYIISDFLDIPVASRVTAIRTKETPAVLIVECKVERGKRQILKINTPVLLGVEAGIAQPHYASLPSVIEAKRQPIQKWSLVDIGLSFEELHPVCPRLECVQINEPRSKPKRVFTPDSNLTAVERMQLVLSGGLSEKERELCEGSAEELSRKFVDFIKERWA